MNMANETISEKCETLYNKLNAFVTSVISRDVTPKISNLNTEVWGSDTQTGNSRIDTLNTNFNNLDGSITSMKSDINNVESDVSNLQTSVNSLSTSITNIISWESINLLNGLTLVYNPALRLAKLTVNRATTGTLSSTKFTNITGFNPIPADYRPHINLIFKTSYPTLMLRVDTSGYLQWRVTSGSVASPTLWCESPFWHY